MAWIVPGGTIRKGETISWDGLSWAAGVDPGPQHLTLRPAVHSCRLVVLAQTRTKIQDGSRIRWDYGLIARNDGWTDTYFEIEGGNHV
jgi:hypothetical protein